MPPKRSAGFKDAPHYLGHRERLRTRFRDAGAEALADYELLELLLFRTQPRRDVKPLAKALLDHFGSFAEVVAATPARLAEVEGMSEMSATDFKVIEAAAQRLARERVRDRKVLSSWSAVIDYCRASMAFAEKEQFRVIRRYARLLGVRLRSSGMSALSLLYPDNQTLIAVAGMSAKCQKRSTYFSKICSASCQ